MGTDSKGQTKGLNQRARARQGKPANSFNTAFSKRLCASGFFTAHEKNNQKSPGIFRNNFQAIDFKQFS
jgi:hypothetical protein